MVNTTIMNHKLNFSTETQYIEICSLRLPLRGGMRILHYLCGISKAE